MATSRKQTSTNVLRFYTAAQQRSWVYSSLPGHLLRTPPSVTLTTSKGMWPPIGMENRRVWEVGTGTGWRGLYILAGVLVVLGALGGREELLCYLGDHR